ncbi:unnamed protein product [Caenorhabditis sp. 36 PRJEB53466]|nr:unnamed protein product [Caenorhabditis sp. 36 PRJEB53466]
MLKAGKKSRAVPVANWNALSVEMKMEVIKRTDIFTRIALRRCSKSDKCIVDAMPVHIPYLQMFSRVTPTITGWWNRRVTQRTTVHVILAFDETHIIKFRPVVSVHPEDKETILSQGLVTFLLSAKNVRIDCVNTVFINKVFDLGSICELVKIEKWMLGDAPFSLGDLVVEKREVEKSATNNESAIVFLVQHFAWSKTMFNDCHMEAYNVDDEEDLLMHMERLEPNDFLIAIGNHAEGLWNILMDVSDGAIDAQDRNTWRWINVDEPEFIYMARNSSCGQIVRITREESKFATCPERSEIPFEDWMYMQLEMEEMSIRNELEEKMEKMEKDCEKKWTNRLVRLFSKS